MTIGFGLGLVCGVWRECSKSRSESRWPGAVHKQLLRRWAVACRQAGVHQDSHPSKARLRLLCSEQVGIWPYGCDATSDITKAEWNDCPGVYFGLFLYVYMLPKISFWVILGEVPMLMWSVYRRGRHRPDLDGSWLSHKRQDQDSLSTFFFYSFSLKPQDACYKLQIPLFLPGESNTHLPWLWIHILPTQAFWRTGNKCIALPKSIT